MDLAEEQEKKKNHNDKTKICNECGFEGSITSFSGGGGKCNSCKARAAREYRARKRQLEDSTSTSTKKSKSGYSFDSGQAWFDHIKHVREHKGQKTWGCMPLRKWFPSDEEHTVAVDLWRKNYKQDVNWYGAQLEKQKDRVLDGSLRQQREHTTADPVLQMRRKQREESFIAPELQQCSTCLEKKVLEEFGKRNDTLLGYRKKCLECSRPQQQKYAQAYEKRVLEQTGKTRGQKRTEMGQYKDYEARHPQRHWVVNLTVEQHQNRRARERERIPSLRQRITRLRNQGRYSQSIIPDIDMPLPNASEHSKNEYETLMKPVTDLLSAPCVYCGRYFDTIGYGVDRLLSDGVYTWDNVAPACPWCNIGKQQLTPKAFVQKCVNVGLHLNLLDMNVVENQTLEKQYVNISSTPTPFAQMANACKNANKIFYTLERLNKDLKLPLEVREEDCFTEEFFNTMRTSPCYYCGYNLSEVGLDRLNSSERYYILSNCVPACAPCNWMKQELSVNDFKQLVTEIAENWGAVCSKMSEAECVRHFSTVWKHNEQKVKASNLSKRTVTHRRKASDVYV
jgi:hypothetical protein